MVMDRISGFSNMGKTLLDRFQGSRRTDAHDRDPATETGSPHEDNRAAPADMAEISSKAHRIIALRHALDSGLTALEGLPEVRPDRVAEVRSRLNRGFYNSVEVRTRVAEKLDDVARNLEDL